VTVKQVLSRLEFLGNLESVAGMARYGIIAKKEILL